MSEPHRLRNRNRTFIPASVFEWVATKLFDKSTFSGGSIGPLIGIPGTALYGYMTARGVLAHEARAVADVLVQRAILLLQMAREMQAIADRGDRGEFSRLTPTELAASYFAELTAKQTTAPAAPLDENAEVGVAQHLRLDEA